MAKLPTPSKPGFNAGDSYNVKYIRIDKIVIDPEISKMFNLSENVIDEICESIKKDGYHKEEPVTLWAGHNILLDGHQRYTAAKRAGEVEIPYVEKTFESRDDVLLYTFERQAIRRNLSGAEILAVSKLLPKQKQKNGEGRAAKSWADRLGVSEDMVYKGKWVAENASEEDIQDIKEGKATVTGVYRKNKQPKEPKEVEFIKNNAQSLPEKVDFLKGAVILLAEKKEIKAVEILINHYFRKNEKRGFYDLLPEAVTAQLPRLPLLVSDEQ